MTIDNSIEKLTGWCIVDTGINGVGNDAITFLLKEKDGIITLDDDSELISDLKKSSILYDAEVDAIVNSIIKKNKLKRIKDDIVKNNIKINNKETAMTDFLKCLLEIIEATKEILN